MTNTTIGIGALVLAFSLSACGETRSDENANALEPNVAAASAVASTEPAANIGTEAPRPAAPASEVEPKPASSKAAPARPIAKPSATTEPAPEPAAPPTPDCPPEHHAMGHC